MAIFRPARSGPLVRRYPAYAPAERSGQSALSSPLSPQRAAMCADETSTWPPRSGVTECPRAGMPGDETDFTPANTPALRVTLVPPSLRSPGEPARRPARPWGFLRSRSYRPPKLDATAAEGRATRNSAVLRALAGFVRLPHDRETRHTSSVSHLPQIVHVTGLLLPRGPVRQDSGAATGGLGAAPDS